MLGYRTITARHEPYHSYFPLMQIDPNDHYHNHHYHHYQQVRVYSSSLSPLYSVILLAVTVIFISIPFSAKVHRLLLAAVRTGDKDRLLNNEELEDQCHHINTKHRVRHRSLNVTLRGLVQRRYYTTGSPVITM